MTSSDDELPIWVQQHQSTQQSPYEKAFAISSSDEEVEIAAPGRGAGVKPKAQLESQAAASTAPSAAPTQEPNTQHTAPAAKAEPLSIAQQIGAAADVTILLPEKVNKAKVLIELITSDDNQATDLSGDSGAVGRLMTIGKPGSEELKIDLKGIIYSASVLPLAGTVMVLNIGPTDAKVETLVNDFVRLKEEASLYGGEALEEGSLADLLDVDDENYQMDAGTQVEDGDKPKKPKIKGDAGATKGKQDKQKAGLRKKLGLKGGGVAKKAGAGKRTGGAGKKGASGKDKGKRTN